MKVACHNAKRPHENGRFKREQNNTSHREKDVEIGCPNLLEILKQGVQIVHLIILLHVK